MVRRSSFLVTAGEMPDFSLLDLDDDGLISEDEYVSYSDSAGTASESEAKAKFTKFDLNSNGTVSEEELADALAAWRGRSDQGAVTAAGLPVR